MDVSVCATNYNTAPVLRQHLESIYAQLPGLGKTEVVIVDNHSTDQSAEILRQMAEAHPTLRWQQARVSRGRGRQLAAEASRGELVVQVDCDTIYGPSWGALLRAYLDSPLSGRCGVHALFTTLVPRHLFVEVGGYQDLQYGEDLDLAMRLAERNAMRWSPLITGTNALPPSREEERRQARSRRELLARLYRRTRDRFIVRREGLWAFLRENRRWTTPLRTYAFWAPLGLAARAGAALAPARCQWSLDRERLASLLVHFDIEGEYLDSWYGLPLPPPSSWTRAGALGSAGGQRL